MSVSLQKGQKISLTKGNEGLSKVIIGLGWDEAAKSKAACWAACSALLVPPSTAMPLPLCCKTASWRTRRTSSTSAI